MIQSSVSNIIQNPRKKELPGDYLTLTNAFGDGGKDEEATIIQPRQPIEKGLPDSIEQSNTSGLRGARTIGISRPRVKRPRNDPDQVPLKKQRRE